MIIDAHSHLWLRQDTTWNGKPIRTHKALKHLLPSFVIKLQSFVC